MKIQVAAQGFAEGDRLRAHAARRLHFALDRFADRVTRARVRLVDMNGPRGGDDIQCLIQVSGTGIGTLVVTTVAADPHTAIDRSAKRIQRLVARVLDYRSNRRGRSARSLRGIARAGRGAARGAVLGSDWSLSA